MEYKKDRTILYLAVLFMAAIVGLCVFLYQLHGQIFLG